ncbi:MAG: HD domain-containing protein [Thermoleophilaceae bacterium]
MTALAADFEQRARPLFARYAYPEWLERHSVLVGRVATLLARARVEAGDCLDLATVALAGYLHDIGRSPLLRADGRDHADLSALALAAEGLGHLAEAVRRHPVYRVLDPALAPRTLEEKLVYVADRRAGQRVESVESRLRDTAERHPRYAGEIERSLAGALDLEREVFAGLRFGPDELAGRLA